jgi:DNA-directed RNA polymerase subunit N (RpoN/RPB10)
MVTITTIRCDRCGQDVGQDWVSLKITASVGEYLHAPGNQIDLCDQCEQMLAAWMRGQEDNQPEMTDEQAREYEATEAQFIADDAKTARKTVKWRGKRRG